VQLAFEADSQHDGGCPPQICERHSGYRPPLCSTEQANQVQVLEPMAIEGIGLPAWHGWRQNGKDSVKLAW
jgi:hypothetical protein